MRLPLVTLVALALATPAAAQMAYRYVFPDGRVVYSDQPVPGAQAQSAIAPPPPSADPAPAAAAPPAADPAPASAAAPAAVPGARWPPPPDAAQPAPASAPAPAPVPVQAAPAARPAPDRIAMFAAADDELRAAERSLAAAKASLEAGQEPLPGERTGLARGGSRLNEAYWDRQAQLKRVVAEAQGRLDRAAAERNALR